MRKMPRLRASHNGSESSAGSTDPKGKHEQDILAKGLATALNSPVCRAHHAEDVTKNYPTCPKTTASIAKLIIPGPCLRHSSKLT